MGLFRKLSGDDDSGQWEHQVRRTAQNHGYQVVKGGRGYVPPDDVLREAGRQQGLSGQALDRAVDAAKQRARREAN
jgi:hypothetical protein